MAKRALSIALALALVLASPGMGGWSAFAEDVGVTYDNQTGKVHVSTSRDVPRMADASQVQDILKKLKDPALRQRASPDQIKQMQDFLQRYRESLETSGTDESRAALKKLRSDLDDNDKELGLSLGEAFDNLSPFLRRSNEESNVVTVLDRTQKSTTVRVSNWQTGAALFTQKSIEINPLITKKLIYRPEPGNANNEQIDAIVFEYKEGTGVVQRVVYNRRIELLLQNLKKLYYDQPSLARKIKENCNVEDPANHRPIAEIAIRPDKRDEQMTNKGCQTMVEIFDNKRDGSKDGKVKGFPKELLAYLGKLAKYAKDGKLEELDWKELQAVQRKAMQFYNDNQLETMQKMVLIELKTYFAQVTNAQVKEDKGTANLDATMKDLGELQKIFDEFKAGNFQGYSLLMTKFFAKADIEDPRYVSKDIMLLASEAFADVANAVAAQKRILAGGLSGDELDATIEESQQWLKLAQVHLQEFDMHTLAIQLERLQSGHLRDHLGLRTDDLKYTINGKEYTLTAKENQDEAIHLAKVATTQYLPKLQQVNSEIKANLLKQALAGFYLTYQNVTRALLYDETMQERVSSMAAKILEIKDLYLSIMFDRVKDSPKFKGKTETQKLQGNLYELFINSLGADYPIVAKNAADLQALCDKLRNLAKIQSAERVREEIKPLIEEFGRLQQAVMTGLGGSTDMPIMDDVKKEAQRLSIKQSKVFAAVSDFSSQARMFDMMNELDLYVAKYASSEFVTSKGDTAASKAIGMKWWDSFMSWITGGFAGHSLRDAAVDGTMKYNPLTQKAFKMLGENRDERHRIMKLLAQGKFQEAYDAIAALDKAGAERAWKEYQDDKAIMDPFEALDFDSSITKAPENKSQIMAQGVVQNMFGQLQSYIMGYTLTAAVYDTMIVSALTLGLGAVSRYAIGAAKGIIAFGEALQAAKSAEAVAQIQKMGTILKILANIGKFVVNMPGKFVVYVGKWLESSMISIRNTLGISNIGKNLSVGEKAWEIVRIGTWNAVKFNVKNTIIMGGASAGIQAGMYLNNPSESQYKSVGDALYQGAVGGVGFGAKSGLFILMSPVPVSAFGEGAVGNVVRGIANSPGPISSLTQGVAKVVASDSAVATIGPLGALKEISLAAAPGYYGAVKALVWSGAMFDGALKYMLASAVAHNVASVGAYYEYKLTHKNDGETEGATVAMQALSQGESFGMTMAEMSWLLLPVHQQSNDKSVREQIGREDGFNAAVSQGLAPEIAQARNGADVVYEKTWETQTWTERITEAFKKGWTKVTGREYEPPKGRLNVDADLRERANKFEMRKMTDAQLLDVATTPRENIGKYRLKAELGIDFDKPNYANEPMSPQEASAGSAKFNKPTQGGEVDLRSLNIRVTDEAITTAKDLLVDRLKGKKGADTRLEILRSGDSFAFNKGRTGAQGESLEVQLTGKRLDSLRETVANTDLESQGRAESGTIWQKLKDMIKGRPIETPGEAIVRNLKSGVKAELSSETKADAAEVEAAAKEVSEAAARLKAKAGRIAASPASVDGTSDEVKDAVGKMESAAQRLSQAADRLNDPKLKMEAAQVLDAAQKVGQKASSGRFTVGGIGESEKEVKKAAGKLALIAGVVEAAGDTLARSGSRLEASELSRKVIETVNAEMQQRIDAKLALSQRMRDAGKTDAADAVEREALALKATRKSMEADAFLQFVNEKMGKDFAAYRSARISEAQIDRSIDLFVETWEKGVFGELWGTAVPDGEGGRRWTIPEEHRFTGRDGGMIPEFRGPQREMLKEVLKSMAEGNQMTMGLLKTSGGKTLLSFVLLSFMDTLARQKGKQGAVYVTVNGDLVAQAYEDYRAFFKGRDPRFQIRTVSDFMADQAMADASGSMSPFKSHDVVFDEYDLLGTITALSLGSDNGRLSHPELDPVQQRLHQGVEELHSFFKKYESLIGRDVDGGRLTRMVNEKGTPFAAEFSDLRDKYVNLVRGAIEDVRGPVFGKGAFERELLDMNSPMYAKLGITSREQFVNRFGMTPEQVYKEMRKEHDHAFGGGWRGLWDVGVISRQQGGLDGYVTKTFLGGIQAMSKPDIAKYYDAQLDPTGKKLVQYHNDVPLDNLDTLYRSFLELKHGIPLTLDFDNLTVVDFAGLNRAAKESGATLVAVSGTLPEQLRTFMRDLGWTIKGEAPPGQALNYKTLDPLLKGARETIGLMRAGKPDEAMMRIDKMGVAAEGQAAIRDLLKAGKIDAAVEKLAEVAPANTMYREVITDIHDLTKANAGSSGPRNLGVFFAESKTEYGKFEGEMDALNPKFSDKTATAARFNELDAQSRRLAARLQALRADPNARAEFARLRGEYQAVEAELDPMRTIPKRRRVVAVTPDSNFLVQEWLMPEGVESKNLEALRAGEADVVILIGQSGFRGLDLPFKVSGKYNNGHIAMYIADPGSLSTVNRRQLTGRIDTGRMPKGATSEVVGIVREQTLLDSEAYGKIASRAINELGTEGMQARWNGIQGVLGRPVDEAVVRDYLKTPPPSDDAQASKTYANVRYLYQDFVTLRELGKIIKPEELQAALKNPAEARKLAARADVARLLLNPDAISSIMTDLQAQEEYKSLEASGIFNKQQPGLLQRLLMRLRAPRMSAPNLLPASP